MSTYLAVLLIVIGIGYGIAFTRTGKVASATLGSRQSEVRTAASPDQAFVAAIEQALSLPAARVA